ncbi:MAG: NUDIX domain-containing protein [Patescibacteria group bacterium]
MRGKKGVIVCVNHVDASRVKRAEKISKKACVKDVVNHPPSVVVRNNMHRGIDYIGVGVGAAIFNSEGKLFLTLRGKKAKNERGAWEIPGGSVEFGETLEDAIIREIKEEHKIDIKVIELLDVCSHIIPDEHQHWVSPTYMCKITRGEPTIVEPEKCDAIGWFTREEAVKLPLSIVTKYDLAQLAKKYPDGFPKLS